MSTVFTEYGIGRIVGSETTGPHQLLGSPVPDLRFGSTRRRSAPPPGSPAACPPVPPTAASAPRRPVPPTHQRHHGLPPTRGGVHPTSVSDVSAQLAPNPDITASPPPGTTRDSPRSTTTTPPPAV